MKGFAANGDAIVAFGPKKYRLVPKALKKLADISIGDHVRVLEDEEKVTALQDGHGGYNSQMTSVRMIVCVFVFMCVYVCLCWCVCVCVCMVCMCVCGVYVLCMCASVCAILPLSLSLCIHL